MDDEMSTQLRTITFSEERKGFDKREVRDYLAEVAEWIEGGGGETVRRRLERIAHKSANMLADAEDGAESLRREAEDEAREMLETAKAEADTTRDNAEADAREQLRDARVEATATRESANEYSAETGRKADEYANQIRAEAKRETDELRDDAAASARETVRNAEQRADQIIADANGRREDVEAVISDLDAKRHEVKSAVRKLAAELEDTVEDSELPVARKRTRIAVEEEAEETQEVEASEESADVLHLDHGLVRNGNGNGSH
jgi:chromosome segregation ATPase